jgi:Fur family ferric uptake transcriptional regulator
MKEQAGRLGQSLRDEGYRLTTSRRIILETLVESGGHISADELALLVHARDSTVSRMTIYRTLDLLGDLGHVRPVYQGARAARFILFENGQHHHFICSQCDNVYELDDCLIDDLLKRMEGSERFVVRAHLLELYGLCENCQ